MMKETANIVVQYMYRSVLSNEFICIVYSAEMAEISTLQINPQYLYQFRALWIVWV